MFSLVLKYLGARETIKPNESVTEGWKGNNITDIRRILNDLMKNSTLYFSKIVLWEKIHQNVFIS